MVVCFFRYSTWVVIRAYPDFTAGYTTNLIGGEWTTGEGVERWIDVNDPSTQRVLTRVPETSHAEMTRIVDKAEEAFFEWRDTSVLRRQGVMLQ